ncbi:hypothetical protein KUV95_16160 [Microbulbifer agarilyticus]|uniref:hypothetical protein n=1 Tax=Microbulbifer agarilyticus TaxID=260552 RepID=UPI001C93B899|nr:hypothetical protein [Microbulbifer agarilyticus]MBY6213085.1 hypothetical protein [Microbulbifer agarilyticus]
MKSLTTITVVVCCSLASFVFGARFGAEQYVLASATGEALVTVVALEQIESGDLTSLKNSFEIRLNGYISNYGTFKRRGYPYILGESHSTIDQERYFSKVAAYRIKNPYSEAGWDKDSLPEILSDGHERYINDYILAMAPYSE